MALKNRSHFVVKQQALQGNFRRYSRDISWKKRQANQTKS